MRTILKLFAVSTFVLFAVNVCGQEIYYQSHKGSIYTADEYAKIKQEKEIGINTYPVNILLDKNGIVVKINGGIPIGSNGEELEND